MYLLPGSHDKDATGIRPTGITYLFSDSQRGFCYPCCIHVFEGFQALNQSTCRCVAASPRSRAGMESAGPKSECEASGFDVLCNPLSLWVLSVFHRVSCVALHVHGQSAALE